MNFTLRAKLGFIAGITTFSFLLMNVVSLILQQRASRQLEQIQQEFLPMVELGPHLDAELEKLRRGFQDAVASQDVEALNRTGHLKDEFLRQIHEALANAGAQDKSGLSDAIENYYQAAYDVSNRSLAKETGEALVEAMTEMQSKQLISERLLKEVTQVDRKKLAMTFENIGSEMRSISQVRTAINIFCLLIVIFLSLYIGRSILNSVRELSIGLNRFGQGDFSKPVRLVGNDELTEVAAQANQMAERISGLMKELASFSYSVAHDLRAPIRSMVGFSTALLEDYSSSLPQEGIDQLKRVTSAAKRMGELIDSLLSLSRLAQKEITRSDVDLSALADEVLETFRKDHPERKITSVVGKGLTARGDPQLLHIVFVNLFGNAIKFSGRKPQTEIEFGTTINDGRKCFFVRDNGAGFDMRYANKLFGTFQRLHSDAEFEGTGIGLATVQKIIHRHNGKIWADSKVDCGTTFYFTLG